MRYQKGQQIRGITYHWYKCPRCGTLVLDIDKRCNNCGFCLKCQ